MWIIVVGIHQSQVTLLAGRESRAVPLKGHGGVIFGSEFLRILDPRARPPAQDDPYNSPRPAATSRYEEDVADPAPRHETRTFLETPGDKPTHESFFSSRHSRKLEPIVSSSSQLSSTSSSFSSSSSTANVFQHIDASAGIKQHSRRMFQQNMNNNRLTPSKKFITSSTNSVKPTTSPVNTLTDRDNANLFRRGSSSVTDHTENLPNVDYDYNYYYLDDLYPLTGSSVESSGRASEVGEHTTSQRITEALPEVGLSSTISQSTSVTATTSPVEPSHKLERKTIGAVQSTSVVPAANTVSTTITPQKTIVSTTTKRPTTKRSIFRYQTTTESAQKVGTLLEDSNASTPKLTLEFKTQPSAAASESPSVFSSPGQKSSETTATTNKSVSVVDTPKPRTSVTVSSSARSSPPPTTPSLPNLKTKITSDSTKSFPSTTISTPESTSAPESTFAPEAEVEDSVQRVMGKDNSPTRHFRYTTPIPKNDSIENQNSTQELTPDDNIHKSLGSSSSSSVVVEVRVEAPRRESRVLETSEVVPLLQTVTREPSKGVLVTPEKVQVVNPDPDTTSFLLSDPLVVDVASTPTTSDQGPDAAPPHRRPPVVLREDTTTTSAPSTTTTDTTTSATTTSTTSTALPDTTASPTTTLRTDTTTTTTKTSAAVMEASALMLQQGPKQLDQVNGLSSNKALEEIQVNRGKNRSVQFETSVVEVSGSVGSDAHVPAEDAAEAESLPGGLSRDGRKIETHQSSPRQQLQSQRVSTSVSRTEARTAGRISSVNAPENLPQELSTSVTAQPSNITQDVSTLASNITLPRGLKSLVGLTEVPHGLAPLGLAPFGQAPAGLAPFGNAPAGLAPHGLVPGGLHPHGLAPKGYGFRHPSLHGLNSTANATQNNGTRLTFVDATVVEGGADANSTVGYVVEEHNISRFRLEEKTSDGFIIGEYGVVDHSTGDVNGVRYTADSTADPHLIYETLMKFLKL
nr:mucin-5AC-like [Procambarus clarkii]